METKLVALLDVLKPGAAKTHEKLIQKSKKRRESNGKPEKTGLEARKSTVDMFRSDDFIL